MTAVVVFLGILAAAGVGAALYFRIQLQKEKATFSSQSQEKVKEIAKQLLQNKFKEADQEAEQLRKQAKQFYERIKSQFQSQQKALEQKEKLLEAQRLSVADKEVSLVKKEEEVAETRKNLLIKLEKVAGMSKEEVQAQYLKEFEASLISYKAKKISAIEKEIKLEAEEKARELIVDAMQSVATEYVDEITVSLVEIGNEEIKGKIIGKEGRNIRAFEKVTGVDVIIDESPTAIGLSSYDGVRREIARIALERLIKDGRIHPVTIEEQYNKAKKDVIVELEKTGKMMAEKANWFDVPAELVPILGRLKYRRSKGQNMVEHTLEVMEIAEYIARELKADVNVVLKAALLHDIGKVLTTKVKKPHHHISGDVGRKYGLDEVIVNAIEAHHEDIEPQSVEAVIMKIADAASGARTGARKENVEDYVERIENLEKTAYEVAGDAAEEVFAVRAGRELRIMVRPSQVNDEAAMVMAQNIAKKIDETGVFPGIVNVVVVREVRAHASSGNS
ncbi:MAG: ribonuclease Y [Candidatus Dojkabacteria bacterium]|nr:MAG: ribonuclease Y [Candidatus Dojkabacteria bacterium]